MHRVVQLYRRDGLLPVLDVLISRARSLRMRRRYGYPAGFLLGYSSVWLTGPYARVGRNFRAGKRCRVEVLDQHNGHSYRPQLSIGRNVSINDEVHIACVHSVRIGDNVLMASKIYISDHDHGDYSGVNQDSPEVPPGDRLLNFAPVVIEDHVWLGEMVTVLPGVTIGRGSIIGANSVVSRDIPPYTIAVGAPARPIKRFNTSSRRWERV